MVVAFLLSVLSVVVLVACVQQARAEGHRAPGLRRARRLRTRPPEDMPPPNLTPLIPSQRVITSECERGLRELTLYLAGHGRD